MYETNFKCFSCGHMLHCDGEKKILLSGYEHFRKVTKYVCGLCGCEMYVQYPLEEEEEEEDDDG